MREYWRGSAEAWECDEMGHLNVRFWVRKFFESTPILAHNLGLGRAFGADATATLLPKRQHIKFMREARAGAPLFLRGGVVELSETDVTFYGEMVHTFSGEIGATFITTFVHADAKSGLPFPFPMRTHALSQSFLVAIPPHGAPRSLQVEAEPETGTIEEARAVGFAHIGQGSVRYDDVDGLDRLYPEGMIGRISNAMPNLLAKWREDATAEMTAIDGTQRTAGAAVLEYRLDYLAWPARGDRIDAYSGLCAVGDKTITLKHWLMNPLTQLPWCVCEAVAVTLDLQARKIVPNPPAARAALEAMLLGPL